MADFTCEVTSDLRLTGAMSVQLILVPGPPVRGGYVRGVGALPAQIGASQTKYLQHQNVMSCRGSSSDVIGAMNFHIHVTAQS